MYASADQDRPWAVRPPEDFAIRLRHGVPEFPVHHMRGGTSTGLVIWDALAPRELALREELLRHLMGVPLTGESPGNRQITGLGRGPATSNKVFFVDVEAGPAGPRLVSTLAQLAAHTAAIDWNVNCGNMSAALPLWALEMGWATPSAGGPCSIAIRNTNTGVITLGRLQRQAGGGLEVSAIPGVDGAFPAVDLFLHAPVGAKTGTLLPTGRPVDDIDGYRVSCVDVAVPMVIADAAQFGKTAHEPVAELEADRDFIAALRKVWIAAGLRMGLKGSDGIPLTEAALARSETLPKVCIVGEPRHGGHLSARYFTPQTAHASLAVSGGCCIASAALIPGTVAHAIARGLPAVGGDLGDCRVAIENPAGVLDTTIVARRAPEGIQIASAAYRRSAQVLLRGHVPLYRASGDLRAWLIRAAEASPIAPA
ncbi:MAG: PrpF domain-containing protein [Pigmentiphaga sp.]|uniref:PrpF domain-containing protein n=1 Tax=Pigmentiphaga sp. TaxID=1977564 RepID=UPI0029B5D994|nr:PrpF domain-containing protein [Pigmentiphaga sp.]MDX3904188.1 PrpF domain-containing protein [Pigmentiphaga sp.]